MAESDAKFQDVCLADRDHAVHVYSDHAELTETVGKYLATSLLDGETVVVFCVPDHLEAFSVILQAAGIDIRTAQERRRLIMLDAGEFLERFMVDGAPDARLFDEVVGALMHEATSNGQVVRAYGEMVALLWEDGNVIGAIQLERLWEALGATTPFSLLCTYSSELMTSPQVAAAFSEMCSLHSQVIAGAPTSPDAEVTRRFAGTIHAPRLARSFATETLLEWGREDLLDDARLVVTELASNAVLYAGSDFTVSMSRRGEGVRVEVADSGAQSPTPRPAGSHFPGGRGLHIVTEVASGWGHRSVPGGKVVWADMGSRGR